MWANGSLVAVGGSSAKYQYEHEPSRAAVLMDGAWRYDAVKPLLANRMWHACTVTNINGQVLQRKPCVVFVRFAYYIISSLISRTLSIKDIEHIQYLRKDFEVADVMYAVVQISSSTIAIK